LNGTPVASGVVNTLDSVITILFGLPADALTSRKPSAPAPPDLLMTTSDCSISPFFWMTPWIIRAIWSAPPPVPAGTTNSTVRVGSHAWAVAAMAQPMAVAVARARARLQAGGKAGMESPLLVYRAPDVEHRCRRPRDNTRTGGGIRAVRVGRREAAGHGPIGSGS
jgi:hypothetical protein